MAGMPLIPSDSFTFNDKNSLTDWGIKIIAYDILFSNKRDRRQEIPRRNGAYDYGPKWYGDRKITLDCCVEDTKKTPTKAALREVSYWLSHKGRLFLWDEPDKHYIGECIDGAEVEVLTKYIKQMFRLEFICKPFAVGRRVVQPVWEGVNPINYFGTAETPTLFVLRNDTDADISNVRLTLTRKKEPYPR